MLRLLHLHRQYRPVVSRGEGGAKLGEISVPTLLREKESQTSYQVLKNELGYCREGVEVGVPRNLAI